MQTKLKDLKKFISNDSIKYNKSKKLFNINFNVPYNIYKSVNTHEIVEDVGLELLKNMEWAYNREFLDTSK